MVEVTSLAVLFMRTQVVQPRVMGGFWENVFDKILEMQESAEGNGHMK